MTSKAVFIGAVTYDTITLVQSYPKQDQRITALAVCHAVGGPAATAAVTCAKLGVPSALIAAVGDDQIGSEILAVLAATEVDTTALITVKSPTGSSVVVAEVTNNTRTICAFSGPIPMINDLGRLLIADSEWVHLDHHGWLLRRQLDSRPRGYQLSVDAGNPLPGFQRSPDLRSVSLYSPNESGLQRDFPVNFGETKVEAKLLSAMKLARQAGTEQVVVTRGGKGAIGLDANGSYKSSGYQAAVVSTLGAGDVFHGALIAAKIRGLSELEQLKYASAVAALSCRGLDGQSMIPDHNEVITFLDRTTELLDSA